jgi:ABC-type lipoprotein release transport system permease subunit
MTWAALVARGLRFHWRAHLGVLLGATLATAILAGALAVGDSVRYSLREMALARLGQVRLALHGQGRFFRAALAGELTAALKTPVAPALLLRGTAESDGAEARADRVQVIGADERFWGLSTPHPPAPSPQTSWRGGDPGSSFEAQALAPRGLPLSTKSVERGPGGEAVSSNAPEGIILNERLAARLAARVGGEVLLRVEKPSLLSRDAPLSTVEDANITLRLPVAAVATDTEFGRFSLEANQIPPLNAFVPLELLQRAIGLPGKANALLVGSSAGPTLTPAAANAALWRRWQLADAGLELRELPGRGLFELTTDQVFLDPAVAQAAMSALPSAQGILTYFVNELRAGSRATPYSTVAAVAAQRSIADSEADGRRQTADDGRRTTDDGLRGVQPSAVLRPPSSVLPTPHSDPLPPDLRDDEIVINQWLADDLAARPGDDLRLTYFVVGPMRHLEEQSRSFRIRSITPLRGAAVDPALMPDFPGVAESKNCRDWEPGIPIDLKRIRDKDEAYWHAYRGTPKAFVTLRAGQAMWNNRFGNLTAVRYAQAGATREQAEACIRQALNPASVGLFFLPVREQALAASSQAMDFGQLFLGFSLFLIIAALLLAALLFTLGMEQRAEEVGILLALGFPLRRARALFLLEGAVLAGIAALAGAAAGVLYTRLMVRGLSTVWRGAVAGSALRYHAEPATLAAGALAGFLAALASIWFVTRRQGRGPVRELLAGGPEDGGRRTEDGSCRTSVLRPSSSVLPWASVLGALALVAGALAAGRAQAAGYFFGAGALLLIGGLLACRRLLARLERNSERQRLTVASLGMRNTARRPGRSLSAIALLSCGSFLVAAVGASRPNPQAEANRRASGAGGFAFYGETTLPIHDDLNSAAGRDQFGLDEEAMRGVRIVPMRLREGDEASCLNLNRAQAPRILGVNPDALQGAFTFAGRVDRGDDRSPWSRLTLPEKDGALPAVGDENTVVWSLGKSVGDTVSMVDDQGRVVLLHIVGILAGSILQGSLLVSEANFVRRFPGQSGYQVFLVDAPPGRAAEAGRELSRALEDVGLELTPAAERLAAFATVENTYLSIFALLGGLGLLLGSLGLGVVVLRNVLERRGELALLRAVGFRAVALQRLVLGEHLLLLTLGLGVGLLAALVAVFPSLRSPGTQVPYASLALLLAAVWLSGFLWVWVATLLALRGPLLPALRSE